MPPTATTPASCVAVVYFSRAGNTAQVARYLARRLDAQLFPPEAPDYPLGVNGLAHALRDANALKSEPGAPTITPHTLGQTPSEASGSARLRDCTTPRRRSGPSSSTTTSMASTCCCSTPSTAGLATITSPNSGPRSWHVARLSEHRHVLRGRMTRQLTPATMIQAIDDQWLGAPASP